MDKSILVETSRWNLLNLNSCDIWCHASQSCSTVICSLMHGWNLVACDKSVTNPFETFLTLNHLYDKLSLNSLVVLDNVRFKLLITSANLSNHIVSLLLKMDLVDTNQVKTALDVDNWNSNVQFLHQLFDLQINLVIFSIVELDWWLVEEHVALLFDFGVRDSSVLSL